MNSHVWLMIRGVAPSLWSHEILTKRQVVGRSSECAIQVVHNTVSRQHAEIWRADNIVTVRDLDSRNGTFVNGVRKTECQLAVGNALQLGQIILDVIASPELIQIGEEDDVTNTTIMLSSKSPELDTRLKDLSPGQRQVLRLLLQGLREKEVATALFISRHTVHTHVRRIYRELGVQSRGQLMALCLERRRDSK